MGEDDVRQPGGGGSRRPAQAGPSVLTPPLGVPVVPLPRSGPEDAAGPAAPPAAPPAPPVVDTCVCGHPQDAHEHYRRGSDCGACGAGVCAAYRPAGEDGGRPSRRARHRPR